jgi:hypothetical protein
VPVKLKDMSLLKNAIALSSVNAGLRALITNIINQSNDSNIASGAGADTTGFLQSRWSSACAGPDS